MAISIRQCTNKPMQAPTRAWLWPARILRLKSLNTGTSGREGYAKSTCLSSISPRIDSTGSASESSGSILVERSKIENTEPTASPPLIISGARLTVSATELAVMTSTTKTLMTFENVESPLLTR
ncbi:hypothetical protein OIU79_001871 [Salix purpurea]|uniref:Uncharacterized protein n=1 Tax=Salix purpurea TaxID=77065 RepID=A0A9Q0UQY0_SALPP|nr:hypothetical protein OIU79_001871 [Salix purpurea]